MLNTSQWLWIWGGLRASWLGNVSLKDGEDAALITSVWIKRGEKKSKDVMLRWSSKLFVLLCR